MFSRQAPFAGALVLLSIAPGDAARAAVMRMTLTGSVSATSGFDGADFFAPVATGTRTRLSVVYDTDLGYKWSDWQIDGGPGINYGHDKSSPGLGVDLRFGDRRVDYVPEYIGAFSNGAVTGGMSMFHIYSTQSWKTSGKTYAVDGFNWLTARTPVVDLATAYDTDELMERGLNFTFYPDEGPYEERSLDIDVDRIRVSPVPLPPALALLATGLLGSGGVLGLRRRRARG